MRKLTRPQQRFLCSLVGLVRTTKDPNRHRVKTKRTHAWILAETKCERLGAVLIVPADAFVECGMGSFEFAHEETSTAGTPVSLNRIPVVIRGWKALEHLVSILTSL